MEAGIELSNPYEGEAKKAGTRKSFDKASFI
jgi:hypothetical protein